MMIYPRVHLKGVSTTDIIVRIVKDYDKYIRRNMSRGYTAKDMNVSFRKAKTIQLEMTMSKMKKDFGNQMKKVEKGTEELLEGFLQLFDYRSPVREKIREKRGAVLDEMKNFFVRRSSKRLKSIKDEKKQTK